MKECQEWCFWKEGRSALALQAPTGRYRKGFREGEEKGPLGKNSLSYPGPSLQSGLCQLRVLESANVPGVGSGVQHVTANTLPGMMVGGRPRDNHQLRKHINQASIWCECWRDHKPRNELQSIANGVAHGARGASVDSNVQGYLRALWDQERGRGSSASLRTRRKAVRWCCGGDIMRWGHRAWWDFALALSVMEPFRQWRPRTWLHLKERVSLTAAWSMNPGRTSAGVQLGS